MNHLCDSNRVAWCIALVFAVPTLAADGDAKTEAEMMPYKEKAGERLGFVPIKSGKFMMGSPKDEKGRKDDEGPQFEVVIEPFWMGKFEVTWDDMREYRDSYEHNPKLRKPIPADREADAVSIPTPTYEQDFRPIINAMGEHGGFPAVDMSRFNAQQFSKWLSRKTGRFYRLPTEAEWEYAARAGTRGAYSFDGGPDKLGEHGWFEANTKLPAGEGHPDFDRTYKKVGTLKPNAWGLHDMHGNVGEWVIDGYDAKHYEKLAGKTVLWSDAIVWPSKMFPSMIRGGHWHADADACRSAAREISDKEFRIQDPNLPKSVWWYTESFHVGFRLVRPLKEPSEKEKAKFWEANVDDINKVIAPGTGPYSEKQHRVLVEPVK